MSLEIVSENRSHGGRQLVVKHPSVATGTDMTFSIFLPPQAEGGGKLPVVWYLSGLTCTHANVTEKGEYRVACAEHGLIFVAPDTSPRGEGVPDDPDGAYDFGLGAGFYVDATQEPYARNYRMWTYVMEELPALVARPVPCRHGPAGHHRPFDGRPWRAYGRAAQSRPLPQRLRIRSHRRAVAGALGPEGAGRATSVRMSRAGESMTQLR